MDTVFWVGLVIGGLLSIPLSITANLWTDKVRDYLDKQRHVRLSHKRSREIYTYFFVRALAEGNPSAKIEFDSDAAISNRTAIYTTFCLVACGFAMMLALEPRFAAYKTFLVLGGVMFVVVGLLAHLLSSLLYRRSRQIFYKLRRFREYEDSIREKWGDDALEEFRGQASQVWPILPPSGQV